jgi:hypothetical protein
VAFGARWLKTQTRLVERIEENAVGAAGDVDGLDGG